MFLRAMLNSYASPSISMPDISLPNPRLFLDNIWEIVALVLGTNFIASFLKYLISKRKMEMADGEALKKEIYKHMDVIKEDLESVRKELDTERESNGNLRKRVAEWESKYYAMERNYKDAEAERIKAVNAYNQVKDEYIFLKEELQKKEAHLDQREAEREKTYKEKLNEVTVIQKRIEAVAS